MSPKRVSDWIFLNMGLVEAIEFLALVSVSERGRGLARDTRGDGRAQSGGIALAQGNRF